MNGQEMRIRAAVELGRHKKRFPQPHDADRRYRCRCGQWKGTPSEWIQHVAGAVLSSVGADLFAAMTKTAAVMSVDEQTPAQTARRYGYEAAAEQAKALLDGCTCRPGLVLRSMGCEVGGHETSDGDLE